MKVFGRIAVVSRSFIGSIAFSSDVVTISIKARIPDLVGALFERKLLPLWSVRKTRMPSLYDIACPLETAPRHDAAVDS